MENPEQNDPAAATAARPPQRPYGKWLILGLAIVVLLYAASPYYSFWRFTVALRAGDRNQLEEMVDFVSLRKSLKEQLRSKIAPRPKQPAEQKKNDIFGALSAGFGPRLIDTLVEAYVTPEGLAAFLVNPKAPAQLGGSSAQPPQPAAQAESPAEVAPSTEPGFRSINWSSVRYAFFTGPQDFAVDLEGTKLHFRFDDLRWQLRAVELDIGEINL